MDFASYAFIAVLSALSALIFLRRLATWETIIRYRAAIDAVFTVGLFAIFAGSFGGALVAAMAGLFLSIMLAILHASRRAANAAREHAWPRS